jgi:prolyl-tRNA editing enzyme YbaK/EbsC (Cys-tRNA(Pro) deacylase)
MADETAALPRAARRVAEVLSGRGHAGEIRLLDASAHSAAEAAVALGVGQQQIVKSLVFRGSRSSRPILALVGGTSRVDPQLLEQHVGEPVERADADWVKAQTGFAIGGVPPVGHAATVRTVADSALVEFAELWAAAGTPHAVFPLRGDELARLTGAELAPIASRGPA